MIVKNIGWKDLFLINGFLTSKAFVGYLWAFNKIIQNLQIERYLDTNNIRYIIYMTRVSKLEFMLL